MEHQKKESGKNVLNKWAGSGSSVVEHLPRHPKVKGYCLATAVSTRRKKVAKSGLNKWAGSASSMVEHLPHHPKVKD